MPSRKPRWKWCSSARSSGPARVRFLLCETPAHPAGVSFWRLVRGRDKQKQVLGFAKDDRKKSKSKKQKQVRGFAEDDRQTGKSKSKKQKQVLGFAKDDRKKSDVAGV